MSSQTPRAIALSLLCWVSPLRAQSEPEEPRTAPDSAASESAASVTSSPVGAVDESARIRLGVQFLGELGAFDRAASAKALARELDAEVVENDPDSSRQLLVSFTRGDGAAVADVVYREGQARTLRRQMRLPERPEAEVEAVVLLAGNMVRDESAELLATLKPVPPPTTPPRVASPIADRESPKVLGFNASLFHPLALFPSSDRATVGFELGLLYSNVGAIQGLLINPGFAFIHDELVGTAVTGAGAIVAGGIEGVHVAGGFSYAGGRLDGLQLTGGFAIAGASGPLGRAERFNQGKPVSAKHNGVQVTGGLNAARGDGDLAQISGGVNFHWQGELDGVQIAAGVNVADRIQGLQLGSVNLAYESTASVGVLNITQKSNFLLGVVNVASEAELALGVINLVGNARTQPIAWYTDIERLSVGLRTQFPLWYTQFWVGANVMNETFDQDGVVELGYAIGIRKDFGPMYLAGDIGAFVASSVVDETIQGGVRLSGSVGAELFDWAGAFAGIANRTDTNGTLPAGLEFFVGAHIF